MLNSKQYDYSLLLNEKLRFSIHFSEVFTKKIDLCINKKFLYAIQHQKNWKFVNIQHNYIYGKLKEQNQFISKFEIAIKIPFVFKLYVYINAIYATNDFMLTILHTFYVYYPYRTSFIIPYMNEVKWKEGI